jgi:hypothetical protein
VSGLRIPAWLRRGLEAGVFAALLGLVTVVVLGWETRLPGPIVLPAGLGAVVVLALPVAALGVLAVTYPVVFAATKGDAILGAITGWVVGANLLALATVLVGQRVLLLGTGLAIQLGIIAALLAAPAALAGLLAAELLTPLGFGRRAGRYAAAASAITATAVLLVVVPLVA